MMIQLLSNTDGSHVLGVSDTSGIHYGIRGTDSIVKIAADKFVAAYNDISGYLDLYSY